MRRFLLSFLILLQVLFGVQAGVAGAPVLERGAGERCTGCVRLVYAKGPLISSEFFVAGRAALRAGSCVVSSCGVSGNALHFRDETKNFTIGGLVNASIDGAISAGLSSAVYGSDFGEGLLASVVSYSADAIAGDLIFETGELFGHHDFSVEKLVTKALINCGAASATGASCASGAIGTVITELAVGLGGDLGADSIEDYERRLELIAAVAGFFTSGGEAENVYATAAAALRDFDNNACGTGLCIGIGILVGLLTAADYALTAKDAAELAEAGLACDAGDQAACNRAAEMAEDFAIETGVSMTVGQLVPGDKVGMAIIGALRRHGDPDIARAADEALERAVETGARRGEIPYWDFEAAEQAYDVIRQSDDIADIARNTGMRETQISRIKDHVFNNTHILDEGRVARFDADPDIANAWGRLQTGRHTDADIQLLNHELFESRFEGIFRTDYRCAHCAANRSGRPSGLEQPTGLE